MDHRRQRQHTQHINRQQIHNITRWMDGQQQRQHTYPDRLTFSTHPTHKAEGSAEWTGHQTHTQLPTQLHSAKIPYIRLNTTNTTAPRLNSQLNSSTAQQLKSSTAQKLHNSTAPQVNRSTGQHFVRSFVRSFVRLFVRSFVRLFVRLFVCLFVRRCVDCLLTHFQSQSVSHSATTNERSQRTKQWMNATNHQPPTLSVSE